jgi:hypothetical protein
MRGPACGWNRFKKGIVHQRKCGIVGREKTDVISVALIGGVRNLSLKSLRYSCSFLICFLLALLSPLPAASKETTSLEDAAKQLAERLSAIASLRGPVRLEYLGEAAQPRAEEEWKAAFRSELEKHHLNLTEEPNAPALRVCVTQTPTQIVFAASTTVAERQEIRIVALNRSSVTAENLPVAAVRLERQLVYESADRILDASSLWSGDDKGLAVLLLRNSELLALRLDPSGATKQAVSIAASNVRLPRDPRAEIVPRGTQAEARLPSRICEFTWDSVNQTKCRAAKFTWRDTTLLTSPCDSTDWRLEAGGSDWTNPDLLQAIPNGTGKQGSAAVMSEFPGPILSINGEQNPNSALIVVRNLRTGNYEVYKITLACGD